MSDMLTRRVIVQDVSAGWATKQRWWAQRYRRRRFWCKSPIKGSRAKASGRLKIQTMSSCVAAALQCWAAKG